MSELDQLQDEIGAWCQRVFADATPDDHLTKLAEEVAELATAWKRGYVLMAPEEAADVVIVLLAFAARVGFSLWDEVIEKQTENQRRHWERQADGTYRHAKAVQP